MSHDAEWMKGASCAQVGDDWWFPEKSEHNSEAKRICFGCVVRSDCLRYALESNQQYGIWGGLSAWERTRLARGRRAA